MSTATLNRRNRSAYPTTVEELLPLARDYAAELGTTPTRNQLIKRFRIGAPKAKILLADLAPAQAEPQREPLRPVTVVEDEMQTYRQPAEASTTPVLPEPGSDTAEPTASPVPTKAPGQTETAESGAPVPAPATVPDDDAGAAPAGRTPRAGAVVALVASAATALTGAVYAANTPLSAAQAWPWPALVTAGLMAVVVLIVLAGSAASVFGALLAGRTARDVALDLASWTVAGVAGFLAAYGQIRFAEWAGVTGSMRYLVPGILEPSVVVLLLLANRRVKRRRAGHPAKPIGKLLALAATLGGFAVYTNVVHAGGKAGLVFGAATVVGLILWWVKLQDDAAPDDWDDAPTSKRLSRRTSSYRLLRWVILPGQTRRAWLISLDHSIADAETGLDLARRWRRAYDQSREAKVSRRLARRHASQQIDAYLLGQQ